MNTRAPRTAAALAASLLFIFWCAAAAGAQTAAGEKVFGGWVGRYPVRMTLRRGAGGELAGSYSYEGRAGSLALKGSSDAKGGFTLEEFDGAKRTGVFKGVGYQMRLANDHLQSVVFTVSQLEYGMAHHAYTFFVVNYDAKAGRRLALADLFKPGSDYLQRISAAAVARLRLLNKEDGDSFLLDPEYVGNASAKPENYQHWTLTERGLAVTFEPYQVGPFAAGSPNVLIPRPGGPLAAHAN
jgi:hypothetical protein